MSFVENSQGEASTGFLTRLAWELPLAVILVLLSTMLGGKWLAEPNLHPKQKPADVRIYELPPSAPSRTGHAFHQQHSVSEAPATPLSKSLSLQKYGKKEGLLHGPASTTKPTVRSPHLPKARHQIRQPVPSRRTQTARLNSPKAHAAQRTPASKEHRALNWADLTAQINSTAEDAANRSAFLQVHDPHTLIARYYIAAILKALQRAGDMIYNGQQTGTVGVRMIIGSDGNVKILKFNPWNSASTLVPMARSIVNVSAPFSPFPANLARRTKQLKIKVLMRFLGNHDVDAE